MTPEDAISRLEEFVSDLEIENARWLSEDDGHEYCLTCAEEQINYFGNGTMIDGGYACLEHDSCCHCHSCGRLLNYSLTDSGIASELDHFHDRRFRPPLCKEEAFHIARIIAGAPSNPEAIQLIQRAVKAIPDIPQTSALAEIRALNPPASP